MTLSMLSATISTSMMVMALVSAFLPLTRWRLPARVGAVILPAALVWAPLFPFSVGMFIRGATGDLSITSLVLLGSVVLQRVFRVRLLDRDQLNRLFAVLVAVGMVFYPLALGAGSVDPYSPGFGTPGFSGALFVLAVLAWLAGQTLLLVCIGLGVLMHALQMYESANLWDYLIDPLVVLWALVDVAGRCFVHSLRQKRGR